MTNRWRDGNANGRGMRTLDLSFSGKPAVAHSKDSVPNKKTAATNSGYRPHGGYRGLKQHPPSLYSFNKSLDYHNELQQDLDHLLGHEFTSKCPSPSWALQVSKKPNHSGESNLFVSRFLSPSSLSQHSEPSPNAFIHSKRRNSAPPRTKKVGYYQPNRTHQYLTATDVPSNAGSEVNSKLGRPTRTMLLRARQRCSSAPINAYNHRRELLKQTEERLEKRRSMTPASSIQEVVEVAPPDPDVNESFHSFLIGARYNQAHLLDSRSLLQYGVYMPRGNPLGVFVVNDSRRKEQEEPPVPPESPASLTGEDDESQPINGRTSPTLPPQRPTSPDTLHPDETCVAWDDGNKTKADVAPPGERMSKPRMSFMDEVIKLDDGLNIKGAGFLGNPNRPRSARPTSARPSSAVTKTVSNSTSLPDVMVTGTALNWVTPRPRDPTDAVQVANQSPPPSAITEKLLNPEISEKFLNENIDMVSPSGRSSPHFVDDVEREDKGVNAPSEPGDYSHLDETSLAMENPVFESSTVAATIDDAGSEGHLSDLIDTEVDDDQPDLVDTDDELEANSVNGRSPSAILRPRTAKHTRTRVRFADEVQPPDEDARKKADAFFLTENKGEKQIQKDLGTTSEAEVDADEVNNENSSGDNNIGCEGSTAVPLESKLSPGRESGDQSQTEGQGTLADGGELLFSEEDVHQPPLGSSGNMEEEEVGSTTELSLELGAELSENIHTAPDKIVRDSTHAGSVGEEAGDPKINLSVPHTELAESERSNTSDQSDTSKPSSHIIKVNIKSVVSDATSGSNGDIS